MHEMALCQGIVEIIQEESRKRAFARVNVVCAWRSARSAMLRLRR